MPAGILKFFIEALWDIDLEKIFEGAFAKIKSLNPSPTSTDVYAVQKRLFEKASKALPDNLTQKINDSEKRGETLLRDFAKKAQAQYKSQKAAYFSIKRVGSTTKDRYVINIHDNINQIRDVLFMTKNSMYAFIMNQYIELVNTSRTPHEHAFFVVGEGEMLQGYNDSPFAPIENFSSIENVHYLAGPIMVGKQTGNSNSSPVVNTAVRHLIKDVGKNATLKLSRNLLFPFKGLYAGYFHCYIVGSYILLEFPHSFLRHDDNDTHVIMLDDKSMADQLLPFFEDYTNLFAKTNSIDPDSRSNLPSDFNFDRLIASVYPATIDEKNAPYDINGLQAAFISHVNPSTSTS